MDNLRSVIKNLFCYISPAQILRNEIAYDNISEDIFLKLGNGYIHHYSNDEIRNMYSFFESEFSWQKHRLMGDLPRKDEEHKLNVFDALTAFSSAVLLEEKGQPVCQYQHLLRWRDMITALEEDLFIAPYLAMRDFLSGKERKNFFWKPVIGHNNYELNCLVAREVAENHFHLKGSAPMFHLSWLSIMNHVDNTEFKSIFEKYDNNKLQQNMEYSSNAARGSYCDMWHQAAIVRLFLFTRLKDEYIDFGKMYMKTSYIEDIFPDLSKKVIRSILEEVAIKKDGDIRKAIESDEILELNGDNELSASQPIENGTFWLRTRQAYTEYMVMRMLSDRLLLQEYITVIQRNIDDLKEKYANNKYDYAICESYLRSNEKNHTNETITGERWFLYSMFSKIYWQDEKLKPYLNWFYLYLVLKSHIRMEIVQSNKNVGFDNFALYQDRKENFIEGTEYAPIYVKMAVRDTIENQHICTLEARITPKNSSDKLQESIKMYDKWICEGLSKEEEKELKKKYFYVLHFIKDKDSEELEECRHYKKRIEVREQARAVVAMRARDIAERKRIRGIDAASAEIFCRPEVFAQAFRYLKNSSNNDTSYNMDLMATYHVGEDFLDIIDGLRAIDETVYFLNFRCGDRLGHALALGIDVREWYESKSYRVLIDKQNYLDNLVWLYAQIRNYNITGCEDAQLYIEKRFSEYFDEIYMNQMTTEECNEIFNAAKKYYDVKKAYHGYNYFPPHFGINEYYDAWKLRGDDPELYKEGFFKQKNMFLDDWDYFGINREQPQNYKIRYSPEVAILYYMYHYNKEVRKCGKQMVEIKVRDCIIEAVIKVRDRMQREIARAGIAIETNPSSNYLIGTFKRYDKHPIKNWYNVGLTYDNELLTKCPQIPVSINTDDQGVFSTYIENEYGYLALALEKARDEKGNYLYNRTNILQWLDNVRRMGINQSFKSDVDF